MRIALSAHDEVWRGAIEAHGYLLSAHTPPFRGLKVREIKAAAVAVDGYGDASSREGF